MTRPAAAQAPEVLDETGTEVWRDTDGRVCAIWYRTLNGHALFVPEVGTFLFHASRDDVLIQPLAAADDELVDDAYHRIALPLARQLRGAAVLHASAVRFPGGIVALCGRAGTGKSTLAFALSRRGHEPCADDAVVFDAAQDPIRVPPLPFRLRLRPESAEWFAAPSLLKGRERGTAWQAVAPAPFQALFVLDRPADAAPGDVDVARLSPADAFPAVLPHAYYVALDDLASNRALVTAYLDLAARLPVFALRYFPALDAVHRIAAAIEAEVQAL